MPALCDYIMEQKWDFDNIVDIATLYHPNRGDIPLIVNNKEVSAEKKLLTDAFDNELISTFSAGKSIGDGKGMEIGLAFLI